MKGILTVSFVLLVCSTGWALEKGEIPAPLAAWQGWVMHGKNAEATCPGLSTDPVRHQCLWPGTLHLAVEQAGGRFRQEVTLFADGFVPLPGETALCPQEVTADGKATPVTFDGGRPRVFLSAGTHTLSGRFVWTRPPHALSVPPTTASLVLTVDGRKVAAPYIDGDDRLWTMRPRETPRENDQVTVEAARLLSDTLPATVTTQLTLSVSGSKRRETLSGALLPGTVPVALESELPARMGEGGTLEVDLRPGKWTVTVTAACDGILSSFDPFGAPFGPEVWAFERSAAMRLVSLEGGSPVDPEMTRIPDEWKRFPAYLMKTGAVLSVTEVRRGQGQTAPRLTLDREVWLDFDGAGATVRDRISGTLDTRRFVSLPEAVYEPGRIRLDGKDRRVSDSGEGRFGVEVQNGAVDLESVSRMGGPFVAMALPVGWNLPFDRTSLAFHLPAGWGLFAVSGASVDSGPVFLEAWSLLDFFLILVVSVAAFKLWGLSWGLLFVVGLTLLWQEPSTPALLWPAVLATSALMRLVGGGDRWRDGVWAHGVRGLHGAVLVSLFTVSLLFASQQLRQALYPQLEPLAPWGRDIALAPPASKGAALTALSESTLEAMDGAMERSVLTTESKALRPAPLPPVEEGETQTGPALPGWRWKRVTASTGPAAETQTVTMYLTPSPLWRGLCVLRVGALLLLLFRVAPRGRMRLSGGAVPLVLMAGFLCLSPRGALAEAFPPQPLLTELETRLTEAPPCHPSCAALTRAVLKLPPTGDGPVTLELRVETQAHVAIPLPSGDGSWRLASASSGDGAPLECLRLEGETWVPLRPGIHALTLKGEGGDGEWTFRFPLAPGIVRVEGGAGWRVSGISDALQVEGAIRAVRVENGPGDDLLTGKGGLISWFRVDREMELGLEWRVVTTVTRNGGDDAGPPVEVSLDLLEGEEIRTELSGMKRTGRSVSVTFPAGVTTRRWESALPPGISLALKAPDSGRVAEVWTLHLDPVWHLAWQGIAPTGGAEEKGLVWHPRRGEAVTLAISRFEGAHGDTLTVDRARLSLWPGNGETRLELEAEIRATKGAELAVASPFNPHVTEVTISGEAVPVSADGDAITVPVSPGRESIRVLWRASESDGLTPLRLLIPRKIAVPELSLGHGASNLDLVMHLSREHWILWTEGPRQGPAVLMWSVVALVALAGFVLGRVPLSPLAGGEWALLGLGLVTRSLTAVVVAAGWFFAMEMRRRHRLEKRLAFNALQLVLAAWGVAVAVVLFEAVKGGLLGVPEMQISGNGSTATMLHWTVDRVAGAFPMPAVWSLPVWTFRLVMLGWSLWLAVKVVGWVRWGGDALGGGGFWMKRPKKATADPEGDGDGVETQG